MIAFPGQSASTIYTVESSGALTAAASGPTHTLYKNGSVVDTTSGSPTVTLTTTTIATGVYRVSFTVPSGWAANDMIELFAATGSTGSAIVGRWVLLPDSLRTMPSFPSNFAALGISVGGAISTVTALSNLPSAPNNWITADSVADAAVSKIQDGLASQLSVDAVKADTSNLVNRITSTLFSGMTSLGRWLGLLAGKTADSTTLAEVNATTAGATYSNVTDSLEAIRDQGDTSWSGGGSGLTGANLVTITVDDGADPVPGAYVRLKAGAETEVKRTDADGVVTFTTDDNTFSVRIMSPGLTFEDVSLAVAADTTITYSMTPVATSTDSWATGEDLVAYYDATTIGQMLKDDRTTVQAADVPNHPVVNRILLLSTGEVNSALMQSNRYSQDQLESMGASSIEHLKNITCAVAMWHLGERRINNNPERQESARKLAELHLERLRKGELVLDVAVNRDAGVAQNVAYVQPGSSQNYPLLRDRMSGIAGHFPKKLFPGS